MASTATTLPDIERLRLEALIRADQSGCPTAC